MSSTQGREQQADECLSNILNECAASIGIEKTAECIQNYQWHWELWFYQSTFTHIDRGHRLHIGDKIRGLTVHSGVKKKLLACKS